MALVKSWGLVGQSQENWFQQNMCGVEYKVGNMKKEQKIQLVLGFGTWTWARRNYEDESHDEMKWPSLVTCAISCLSASSLPFYLPSVMPGQGPHEWLAFASCLPVRLAIWGCWWRMRDLLLPVSCGLLVCFLSLGTSRQPHFFMKPGSSSCSRSSRWI